VSERKRREPPIDPNAVPEDDGRPPPFDDPAERAFLSCVMVLPSVLDLVPWMHPGMFYGGKNRLIMEAAVTLHTAGAKVDSVTIATWLREHDRLGQVEMHYIAETLLSGQKVEHAEDYARAIRDAWRMRSAIATLRKHASLAYLEHGSTDEYLGALEREVLDLAAHAHFKKHERLTPILKRVYDRTAASQQSGKLPGIPRGLRDYDEKTTGIRLRTLEILAARPSMGKTALALVIARNVAGRLPELFGDEDAYHGVAVFSLEMQAEECGQRLLAAEGRVEYTALRQERLTPDQWAGLARAANRLHTLPIVIDDTPALEIQALRARVRRIKTEMARPGYTAGHPTRLRVVVIDYLQLLRAEGDSIRSREQEIAMVSRTLKTLAKEEDVAVIALAQLNRNIEGAAKGARRRPQLSDLRESGQIEQDADIITFIHREEYYDPSAVAPGEEGKTEIIIGKQRGGPTGTVHARFSGRYQSFQDM